jgi:hypothetical protein
MPGIFISYRRDDSAGFAGRLADALEARFGAAPVFRDVQDIRAGDDFVRAIDRSLAACQVLLAVIGPRWLSATDAVGRRRIDDRADFVRIEIAAALRRGVHVIPVLVDGATMPGRVALPGSLSALARRQAVTLGDTTWDTDVQRVIRDIEAQLGRPGISRRRWLMGAAGAAGLISLVALTTWWLGRPRLVAGAWRTAEGNVWFIRQSGIELIIEDTHYETHEVWRKGRGRIAGDTVQVDLAYTFQPGLTMGGKLTIDSDGQSMHGTLLEVPSGRAIQVSLRR